MGSILHPADASIKKWREADTCAAAAEQALINQAKAHLIDGQASPTLLQRSTAQLLREDADRLLVEAMRKVEEMKGTAVDIEPSAAQLAALKSAEP